jgi:NADPH:quinone reductase-like Zn-dependent oxidoreductase
VEVLAREHVDFRVGPRRYDLVMDCVGTSGFSDLRSLVKPGGAYLAVAGGLPEFFARSRQGVRCVASYTPESARVVQELVAFTLAGEFRPAFGERFGFSEVPAAHALADSGRKRGTAVVDVSKP